MSRLKLCLNIIQYINKLTLHTNPVHGGLNDNNAFALNTVISPLNLSNKSYVVEIY